MRRPGNIKFVKAGAAERAGTQYPSRPPAPAPLTPGPRGTITYLLDVRLKCWYVPKCLDSLSLASPGIVRIRHLSAIGRGRLHCARTESVSNDAGGWGVSPKICYSRIQSKITTPRCCQEGVVYFYPASLCFPPPSNRRPERDRTVAATLTFSTVPHFRCRKDSRRAQGLPPDRHHSLPPFLPSIFPQPAFTLI